MRIPAVLHLARGARRKVRCWDICHLDEQHGRTEEPTEGDVEEAVDSAFSNAQTHAASSSFAIREVLRGMHWQHAFHAAQAIRKSWPQGQAIPCAVVKDVFLVSQTAIRKSGTHLSRRGTPRPNKAEIGGDGCREMHQIVISYLERMDFSDTVSEVASTAAQAATCLWGASPQSVNAVFILLLRHNCVDASVACKLLVALGAASRETYHLPRGLAAMVQQLMEVVISSLQRGSPSSVECMHDSLQHGCEAFLRLSQFDAIIDTYRRVPNLPPSFAYVSAHLSVGNVAGAIANLATLVDNRTDWRVFQSSLVLSMHEAARAVGLAGDADEAHALLTTVSRFYTPSLFLSRVVESMVSGITERCRRTLAAVDAPKPSLAIPPIASVLRTAMQFVGCDFNQDAVLYLLDEVSRSPSKLAVPLGVAVVNVLEGCDALGVRKAALHWYRGYVLQHCRSIGSFEHVEHFVAAWDGVVPAGEDNRPLDSSWVCKSCGRINGARYSFCSCSALQFGVVACSTCSFSQDERHTSCLVCAAPIQLGASSAVEPLCNWRCHACNAMNMAFQRFQCSKCGAAKAPLGDCTVGVQKSCCNCCLSPSHRSCAQEPYCMQCGSREAWFTNAATQVTWYCGACGSFHAGTDSICPVFGNSERLNATPCRPWDTPVVCDACDHVHHNPFVVACSKCNHDLSTVGVIAPPLLLEQPRSRASALTCGGCSHVNFNACASHACGKCRQLLHDAELTAVVTEPCTHCGHVERSHCLSFVCSACGGFSVLPGSAADARAGWANVQATIGLLVTAVATPTNLKEVLEAIAAITGRLEVCPKQILKTIQSYDVSLRALVLTTLPNRLSSRRCLVLWERIVSIPSCRSDSVPAAEPCGECGGSHPTVTCGFVQGRWMCPSCSTANTNDGLGRYYCLSCVELRPEIACLSPSSAWTCTACSTLNLDLETSCVHCGHDCGADDMDAAHSIPLVPSRCEACNRIFLEAMCPYCNAKQSPDTNPSYSESADASTHAVAHGAVEAVAAQRTDRIGDTVAPPQNASPYWVADARRQRRVQAL